jgi:hypothetical protein
LSLYDLIKQADLQAGCITALQAATGKMVISARSTTQLNQSPYRLLIRVGILGPAIGGQCVFDIPLLTSLNLSAFSLCGRNYTTLNSEEGSTRDELLRKLLGLPAQDTARIYTCTDPWVKSISINLGALYNNEEMKIAVVESKGDDRHPEKLRIRLGQEKPISLALDHEQRAELLLENRRFLFKVLDTNRIEVDIDESQLTLGTVPSILNEHHIVTPLNGPKHLVKAGSSLVRSRLLEMTNQVAPALIPPQLTGDISTPQIIPARSRHLPLPNLHKLNLNLLLMGLGTLTISLELCNIAELHPEQIHVLKGLFNFTFYHPELKKIFG